MCLLTKGSSEPFFVSVDTGSGVIYYMKYIGAVLFTVFSLTAFGETLITRDYSTKPATPKPVIKKVKLLRSHPYRFTAIRFANLNPADVVDDEDILPQKRYRSRLEEEIDDTVSDSVAMRLFIARSLALRKYLEVHGDLV